ncbi:30S ribosomal protein S17 [Rickettsiales bacterium]|nr:30S ribosomal protein S17 [Rickettsiales bacterium]
MSHGYLTGVVLKRVDSSTLSVLVMRKVQHPIFGKVVKRFKKYLVHDLYQKSQAGDTVNIKPTRPISRRKSFMLYTKD